jgi:FtsH-binding integral membrane protein
VGSGRAAAAAPSGDKSGKKAANLKEMGRGILRGILGIWAILFVALSALVSLIERDRPDLLSSGNPFVVGVVICASVVTVLFFGFAWLIQQCFSVDRGW